MKYVTSFPLRARSIGVLKLTKYILIKVSLLSTCFRAEHYVARGKRTFIVFSSGAYDSITRHNGL